MAAPSWDSSKTAWCWRTGASGNAYGQLGNGTTDTLTTSFQASEVLTAANTPLANVVAIADLEVPFVFSNPVEGRRRVCSDWGWKALLLG